MPTPEIATIYLDARRRIDALPPRVQRAIRAAEAATARYDRRILNVGVAYGGREEIVDAVRAYLSQAAADGKTLDDLASHFDAHDVERLIGEAQSDIDAELATDVLIIEDEAIISADIESLVKELGHRVTGTATTHDEAVDAVARHRPGLVLADIQLADGSSGIDAVKDILKRIDVPVIFITAFPERLLTGERPEPTFLITKPFQPETVKAAISQALFFHPSRQKEAA